MLAKERRIGRYVLLEPVGTGAMGTVYRGEDPSIHRTVAVKVLHAPMGLTAEQISIVRERFRREAQTAGSIDHPNIIRIFDVGEEVESGEMYIVMEYLAGPSLDKMIDRDGLALHEAVGIAGHIAAGLDAAHAQGLVHRDIKPSNVLFNETGTPKLVDFGISHVASSCLTQDMTKLGTPAYMSPEHVSGRAVDARADLFSLGVLTYEMLTGRKPFRGDDVVAIAYAIAHTEPVPVSIANPALPPALDALMDRMLAKEPSERFGSGREFHEALLGCLQGASKVGSSKPKPAHRALFAAVGVTMLATLGILISRVEPAGSTVVATRASVKPAAKPGRPAVPAPVAKAPITISLTSRIRHGNLVVALDDVPVFNEEFQKPALLISQTTTWDPLLVTVGKHKLTAKIYGEKGKTYVSGTYDLDVSRTKGIELRIRMKGNTLTVEPAS